MIRFIDLTGQVTLGADSYFAWLDTSTDRFETHGGTQYWSSWKDFVEDYEGVEIERYRKLADAWVFQNESTTSGEQAVTAAEVTKLAKLWVSLAGLKEEIDNTTVPLGAYLGLEDPDLMLGLEELSALIQKHFEKFRLVAVARKYGK